MEMRPVLAAFFCLLAWPVWADARATVLVDVLKIDEIARILQVEGLKYAEALEDDMLDGQGGGGWDLQVSAIYNPERIVNTLHAHLQDKVQGELREEIIQFYATDLGETILSLENSARAAIIDDSVEQAARAGFKAIEKSDDTRLAQITTLVDVGDMASRNVTAAMNSNFQFMRGLAEGGALDLTQNEILADVSAQEDAITQDTRDWLFGYLLLAYSPLDDASLDQYLTFAQSEAGLTLNRALFEGFEAAYADISYALGRAVAVNMVAEDL